MAILVSWLLCFIFTVTDVFPPEVDKYGFYARTDARQGILAVAPWFKIPYPCKCVCEVLYMNIFILKFLCCTSTVVELSQSLVRDKGAETIVFRTFSVFLFYSPVGCSYCNSCRCNRYDECGGGQHHRIHWRLLCLCTSLLCPSTSHPCHQ